MNEIINIVRNSNHKGSVLSIEEIRKIIFILATIYQVEINGVDVKKGQNTSIFYNADSNVIVIDPEKFYSNNMLVFSNYKILFSLVHEMRHAIQYIDSLLKDDSISKIYLSCFDFIGKNNTLSKVFYSVNHDAFPIEINSDIVAYLFVIYVANLLGDTIHAQIFSNMLLDRIDSINNSNYDVLTCISDGDTILELSLIDEYTLFINGLLRDKDKCKNFIKSLTVCK